MPFHSRRRLGGDVLAVFVHAGAGYHSVLNQKTHLQACEDAAKSAMTFLKNGGSAVEAVEMAIKILEDREITNSGYGSNLAMDGTVECDATIVDHFGRSGAVGAVGQVQNPIQLARLVLEHSTRPLSLRRVPPNLLVGQGAADFAFEHGIPVLPPDCLVSPAARERWRRWNSDLKQVEGRRGSEAQKSSHEQTTNDQNNDVRPNDRSHLAGVWNESQPFSPQSTATETSDADGTVGVSVSPRRRPLVESATEIPTPTLSNEADGSSRALGPYPEVCTDANASISCSLLPPSKSGDDNKSLYTGISSDEEDNSDDAGSFVDDNPLFTANQLPRLNYPDSLHSSTVYGTQYAPIATQMSSFDDLEGFSQPPEPIASLHNEQLHTSNSAQANSSIAQNPPKDRPQEDHVTDTVGAIAIDCFGNIAAGSSSGGIGMKHKGRTGPAALVGIGTAVLPVEPEDKYQHCVATVTSGTGEHMATTIAATTCANRLYYAHRKGIAGKLHATDEDTAMRYFIEKDFMDHPSVKNSNCAGAIGVMAVKKATNGVWLYFGHNTDSFAIASMSSEDDQPVSVMSRNTSKAPVLTGGRSIKFRGRAEPAKPEEPKAKRQKTSVPAKPTEPAKPTKPHGYYDPAIGRAARALGPMF